MCGCFGAPHACMVPMNFRREIRPIACNWSYGWWWWASCGCWQLPSGCPARAPRDYNCYAMSPVLHLIFEAESLTDLEHTDFLDLLGSKLWGPPDSTSPVLEIQIQTAHLAFPWVLSIRTLYWACYPLSWILNLLPKLGLVYGLFIYFFLHHEEQISPGLYFFFIATSPWPKNSLVLS